jgi:hypothetical protein
MPHGPMPHGPLRHYGSAEPDGPMPHGPIRPHYEPMQSHGFLGPHGPMPHGPHFGPHGFLGPHHPDFEGKHLESGYIRHHGSRRTIEETKTYQVNTEPRRKVDDKPKPEERTLPVRRESPEMKPREFRPPHGPFGPHHGLMPHGPFGPHHAPSAPHYQPHGFMPPHGPFGPHGFIPPHGPHHEPHGFRREERTLTEENTKRNVIGVSQIRFQQTTSKSDNGDNYEYFESKHVVKSGRVNQPITVHHRRGGKGDGDNQLSQSVNRSSSYNKTSTQIQNRNINTGSKIEGTKYTQKTTNIRVKEGNNDGKGIYTEYKKYTQKVTGSSSINTSKYGANTVNAGSRATNKSQYGANTNNSGASSINKSKYSAGNINMSKYTNISAKNETSSIKSQYSSGNANMSKYNTGSNNMSKYGVGSFKNNEEIKKNVDSSSRQEKYNIIKKTEEKDVLCQTFDESEFEIIFCPVHGKQYVKKKKMKKFN